MSTYMSPTAVSADVYKRTVPGISQMVNNNVSSPFSSSNYNSNDVNVNAATGANANPGKRIDSNDVEHRLYGLYTNIQELGQQSQMYHAQNVSRQDRLLNEICRNEKNTSVMLTVLVSFTVLTFLLVLTVALYTTILPLWRGKNPEAKEILVDDKKSTKPITISPLVEEVL